MRTKKPSHDPESFIKGAKAEQDTKQSVDKSTSRQADKSIEWESDMPMVQPKFVRRKYTFYLTPGALGWQLQRLALEMRMSGVTVKDKDGKDRDIDASYLASEAVRDLLLKYKVKLIEEDT